ncbi:uncharacterized protein LOC132259304 isoform X2 [Phlebotomus argentipes]|uniref:uncharacterized protein LOC132259304 isoform X2 n=1 Tax=Phlebotomus argentipes TaxID=94469 RepID=UPI002893036F|nr:uncharacterized protein LOC132259304 isoform X2 [Phlebotomus argentipes]
MAKARGLTTSVLSAPKSCPMVYGDLFSAVFKIPHESVKTRVLHAVVAALNGDSPLRSCRCSAQVETTDRSSQTTFDETASAEVAAETQVDTQKPQIISVGGVVKLGKKRRNLTPQASTGQDLGVRFSGRQKTTSTARTKVWPKVSSVSTKDYLEEAIAAAIDDCGNIDKMIEDLGQNKAIDMDKTVKDMMLKDWLECDKLKNGFLPIHSAVLDGDEIYLKRQCLTLDFRGFGVDLKTSDGFTALHMALKCQAEMPIVQLLLNYNASVSTLDASGNNSVLLAGKHCKDLQIFTIILRKTPFSELQRENFQSHGIFRVVVDSERVDFLHELLYYVDECLGLQSIFPKNFDEKKISMEKYYVEKLQEFTRLSADEDLRISERKARLLNQRDKTAGKTPLFCAVEKQKEHRHVFESKNISLL